MCVAYFNYVFLFGISCEFNSHNTKPANIGAQSGLVDI